MFCFSSTLKMQRTGWRETCHSMETLQPCPINLTIKETWIIGRAREAQKTQPPLETWAVLFL